MASEGRYSRIKSRFWTDEKSSQWTDDEKLLALYLLSCPHGNMLGCFVLPRLYICSDLKWEPERLAEPFAKLLAERFIKYDEAVSLVLICNWILHNPIENLNQVKAAQKVLRELPKSSFLNDLAHKLEAQGKEHLAVLLGKCRECVPPGTVTETVAQTVTETVPQTVTGTRNRNRIRIRIRNKDICASDNALAHLFDEFWSAYPKKRSKKDAQKAWEKLNVTPSLFATIMSALETTKASDDSLKAKGQYVPLPATWLRGQRWEDQLEVEVAEDRRVTSASFMDLLTPERLNAAYLERA